MLQRIQSVFLFLAAALSLTPFALPFAVSPEGAVLSSNIFADGIYDVSDHASFPYLFGLAALLALVTLVLFRRRPLQMRMAMLTAIVILAAIVFVVVFYIDGATAEAEGVNIRLGALFPPLAFLFALFAHRYIKKDEKLVQSMDRLR